MADRLSEIFAQDRYPLPRPDPRREPQAQAFHPFLYQRGRGLIPQPERDPRRFWEIQDEMDPQAALIFQSMPRYRGVNSMMRYPERFEDMLSRAPPGSGAIEDLRDESGVLADLRRLEPEYKAEPTPEDAEWSRQAILDYYTRPPSSMALQAGVGQLDPTWAYRHR